MSVYVHADLNELTFYKGINELREISRKLRTLISQNISLAGFMDRLSAADCRLDRESLNVLVVGEFSRGKSTLINAFLGSPVLPSSVNPTTATINIIRGGPEPTLRIRYINRNDLILKMPKEKTNHFLGEYVTTKNISSCDISSVEIVWPGILENIKSVIVDTPGINDIDLNRERITYEYLSKSDACIVVLDSQQPLSQSEKIFIRDQIFKRDIFRLVFVINKADQVADTPEDPDIERICNYVRGNLTHILPEGFPPKVYAVSSRNVLRAKLDGSPCPWLDQFIRFQSSLLDLMSDNALRTRFPEFCQMYRNIATDMLFQLRHELSINNANKEQIVQCIRELSVQEKQFQIEMRAIIQTIQNYRNELSARIRETSQAGFAHIEFKLLEKARLLDLKQPESLNELKSVYATESRNCIEAVRQELLIFHRELNNRLKAKFPNVFSCPGLSAIPAEGKKDFSRVIESVQKSDRNFDDVILLNSVPPEKIDSEGMSLLAVGAAAVVGGATFGLVGGFIGFVAGVLFRRSLKERLNEITVKTNDIDADQYLKVMRGKITAALREVRQRADEIAEESIKDMTAQFKVIASNNLQVNQALLQHSIQLQRDQFQAQDNETERISRVSEELNRLLQDMERMGC